MASSNGIHFFFFYWKQTNLNDFVVNSLIPILLFEWLVVCLLPHCEMSVDDVYRWD